MRPVKDKEISCRITRTLLMYVREKNNGSLGSLLDGLELDQHFLMDTNNWVSHAFLQALYHRMIQILGDENAVYSMTLASERFQSLGLLDRIVRLIGTPKLIYGQAPKLNKLLKLNGDVFIHEMGEFWVLLEDRYHNSAQKTRYDCDYTRGVLAGIPTMFGMPLAHVEEMECQVRADVYGERVWPDHPAYGARGCLYRVHWKGAKSGFLWKRFFARRRIYEKAIQDLQGANQQIQEKYDEARQLATSLEKANTALTVSKSKLESSERRYRLLAENASDIIWTLNLETRRFDYVSPSVLRLRGITPGEAMEMSLEETLSPASFELALKIMAEELERDGKEGVDPNRSRTLEIQQACKDGSFVWAEATMTFIRSEEGRPVGVLGATRDIRERKRAERALRDSEQRLNRAQEIGHLGSWELDLVNNRLTWSNEVYCIFGVAPHEFGATYEAFLECVHPDDRAAVDAGYSGSLRENLDSYEVEHRVVRKDTGEIRVVHEKCEHFRDATGKIIRSVGMVQDITERRRMEEALRKSRDELELRVDERTTELKERVEQLARLSGQLTVAEQRERRRLAVIIHDHLQQMLVGAKIGLEVMANRLGEADQKKIREICGLMVDCLKTARSLNTQLSPIILYERGLGSALKWLAETMQETYSLVVETLIDPDIDVEQEEAKVLLFESVRELLFNVVKHARTSSARVEMARDDKDCLRITVRDHGVGFDPEMMLKRASEDHFGLFSIRERLELIGGKLAIESSPGHGAAFRLIVPAHVLTSSKDGSGGKHDISLQQTVTAAIQTGKKIRVLLVDDHVVMRQGLSSLLSEHPDIEIAGEAADGEEAVQMARRLQPDVILMDISMPKMNGIDATKVIHSESPHIRTIGLSMYDDAQTEKGMRDAGAVAFVNKGSRSDALVNAVRQSILEKAAQ